MTVLKYIATGLLILLLVATVFMTVRMVLYGAESRRMQPDLGVVDGELVACPATPNCVSSQAMDGAHSIDAIQGDANAFAQLGFHIGSLHRVNIVEQNSNYLHATYESGLFGFVDDLELYFDGSQIDLRSASRVGYSDLDANRKRVDGLRLVVDGL